MADPQPVDDWIRIDPRTAGTLNVPPVTPANTPNIPFSINPKTAGTLNPPATAPAGASIDDWQRDQHNEPGALERFWGNMINAINPIPGLEQWWDRISNRQEDMADMSHALSVGIRARGRKMTPDEQAIFDKGMQAQARQDVGTAQPSVIPMAGQPAVTAGVQARQGDIAGAAGTLTGAYGIPYAVGRGINAGTRFVSGMMEADPVVAMVRALKPSPSDVGFTDRLPQTLANIKAASTKPIINNEQLINVTRFAIGKRRAAFDNLIDTYGGPPIAGDDIAAAGEQAIPSTLRVEDPAAAAQMRKQVTQGYAGQRFSPEQLKRLLEEKNAELNSFYSKSPAKQAAAASGLPVSVVKAQRDAIADTLYNALDEPNAGAGPRQIQLEMRDMLDMLEAAQARRNAIMQEKPVSKAGKFGTAAARVADLPGKALSGEIEQGLSNISGSFRGMSDPLIQRAFEAIGEHARAKK